jgi:hypothetical protein
VKYARSQGFKEIYAEQTNPLSYQGAIGFFDVQIVNKVVLAEYLNG